MKTVQYDKTCPSGKRRFADEVDARKALGRAQTKAYRRAENRYGSRRGLRVESRAYYHDTCDGWHLTNEPHNVRRICTEMPELNFYEMGIAL